MKYTITIAAIFLAVAVFSQTTADYAVQLTATVQDNPPRITLNWVNDNNAVNYLLYRKLKEDNSWGSVVATLAGTDVQYVDTTVTVGISYEYKLRKAGGSYIGYGYINSGIKVAETEYRGKMILIVDSTYANGLSSELSRLEKDLVTDGWEVIRYNVSRNDTVPDIKALIVNEYNADPLNVKSVFLFGHVPVPYSGNINPDGHPDHKGAWPADGFYGDMDGTWTDNTVNNTVANDPRNDNIPGDGKYDQSLIPTDIELQVGRVDMANMPAFIETEEELLRRYLNKNNMYRQKLLTAQPRALIDDNFGTFGGEAFAANGWKNFSTMVGSANVSSLDYFSTLTANSYLWSYGCGGGTYTSAGGIGNTNNFAADSLQSIFTILFGSYFGDWDKTNNFLRAPLASGATLSNFWAGRPHWQVHHMAMGENIGYGARLSQNNSTLYLSNIAARWIHVALMGDPSLRLHIIAPPKNLVAHVVNNNTVDVIWTASSDTVLGYHLYRKNGSSNFIRLNSSIITDTTYTDSCVVFSADYTYMARAIKLETSFSGSYYNLSQGVCGDTTISNDISIVADFSYQVNLDTVFFTDLSTNNSVAWYWWFDDGYTSTQQHPTYVYNNNGTYNVMLIASHDCHADTAYQTVTITGVGIDEETLPLAMILYPNPTTGNLIVELPSGIKENTMLTFQSVDGRVLWQKIVGPNFNLKQQLDISKYPKGFYILTLNNHSGRTLASPIVLK